MTIFTNDPIETYTEPMSPPMKAIAPELAALDGAIWFDVLSIPPVCCFSFQTSTCDIELRRNPTPFSFFDDYNIIFILLRTDWVRLRTIITRKYILKGLYYWPVLYRFTSSILVPESRQGEIFFIQEWYFIY